MRCADLHGQAISRASNPHTLTDRGYDSSIRSAIHTYRRETHARGFRARPWTVMLTAHARCRHRLYQLHISVGTFAANDEPLIEKTMSTQAPERSHVHSAASRAVNVRHNNRAHGRHSPDAQASLCFASTDRRTASNTSSPTIVA